MEVNKSIIELGAFDMGILLYVWTNTFWTNLFESNKAIRFLPMPDLE